MSSVISSASKPEMPSIAEAYITGKSSCSSVPPSLSNRSKT